MTEPALLSGLTAEQVLQRQQLGQVNSLKTYTSRNIRTILRSNLLTLFNGVVGAAFLVLLALGQWPDALFGLAVLFNVSIGIVQELRSKRALDKLSVIGQKLVSLRRSGTSLLLPKEQLVLDDLLELRPGDQLVVDALVVESHNLEVDESLLTGEAEPVVKTKGETLLSGSFVLAGSALATVCRVGDATYANELTKRAKRFTRVSSEIQDSLNKIVRWISWALIPLVALTIFGQLKNSDDVVSSITRAVASVISMVPQGLVLISSITFAMSAIRLARRKVLVQELAAVEGLARVNVICFDKTGTLTTGAFEFHEARLLGEPDSNLWRDVLGAFVHQDSANATALALRKNFPKPEINITQAEEFSSATKYSSITVDSQTWKLGAPEVLTKDQRTLQLTEELAGSGLRVLLLGIQKEVFIPKVLISLKEELNPKAFSTLKYFIDQGVSIKILSGDHPRTIAAVARAAGLDYVGEGLDARNLEANNSAVLKEEIIFGRVTPERKEQIISSLQSLSHVVAMVGDGINDVLALKQADLGIAMGGGSAATRATADLILVDDDFSQLPKVVAEGRRVIANVERLSGLFLTKTVWAMALTIIFGLTLWDFPFLPRQVAAIDAFTIGIPAFLIALLPNQRAYQKGFLVRALKFCIPAGLLTATAVTLLKLSTSYSDLWSTEQTQTATMILLSCSGLTVLSIASRPWSSTKVVIFSGMFVLGIAIFLVPFSASFFQFVSLTKEQLVVTSLLAAIQVVVIELSSRLIKR